MHNNLLISLAKQTKWSVFFNQELSKTYFLSLLKKLEIAYQKENIFPNKELIFNAFSFFNPIETKIIIIGQDPYPNNHANGLAFSSTHPKTPRSLQNIKKEILLEYGREVKGNDLTFLARQKVLLINTNLTVKEDKPLSHSNIGWEMFTNNLINYININCQNVVFLLWGNNSKKFTNNITNKTFLIIETSHPSPFSANKGFIGSLQFKQANNFLKQKKIEEIRWWNV